MQIDRQTDRHIDREIKQNQMCMHGQHYVYNVYRSLARRTSTFNTTGTQNTCHQMLPDMHCQMAPRGAATVACYLARLFSDWSPFIAMKRVQFFGPTLPPCIISPINCFPGFSCSRSSVEQSSITRHCCPPLSPSSAIVLNHLFSLSYPTF